MQLNGRERLRRERMKRVMWVVLAVLFFCITARAQETPAWEINGGYSYMRANLNGPGSGFHMKGGIASVTENLNDWFGGRLEISAFGGRTGGTNVTPQTFTYGPVFVFPRFHALSPFAHAHVGALHE